jgi:putative Ca2+/H+ antiporter (TMEM165/GDT1 family)
MDSNSRGVILGLVLGVLFVVGVAVIGFDWGTQRIQTASLPVDFPIMFQPK